MNNLEQSITYLSILTNRFKGGLVTEGDYKREVMKTCDEILTFLRPKAAPSPTHIPSKKR